MTSGFQTVQRVPDRYFGASVAVKDRRVSKGHVQLSGLTNGSAAPFGSRSIVALRHFPSMYEGQHDQPAIFELVRLQAENVQASRVWEGDPALTIYDSPIEPLATLKPQRIGRGWRYSIAMTNRSNHLLRDLRGTTSSGEK
ncbi:acetoacetate decarboxylase family protein [Zymomonas mobilis]|nr:acetoacetate decarboxylase family protein [Zymomonas mobilis]UBQ07832.1 acetoacetate decarboxylase family protein [Zymomonas mobilis]